MSSNPPVDVVPGDAYAPPPEWVAAPEPSAPSGAVAGPVAEPADLVGHGRDRYLRFVPRSLSGRLVAGVVGLVVALVLATSVCTYIALRSFLLNRLDQQLEPISNPEAVRFLINGQFGANAGFEVPQKVWVEVLAKTATPASDQPAGRDFAALGLDQADRVRLVGGTTKPSSIRTAGHDHVRVVAVTGLVNAATGEPVTVVVGLSQDEVDRTLHRLVLLELAIGIAAIVLAFGATSWGVKFSLRRLRTVTNTAQEVAAELSPSGAGLDRRVEVDEPDTEVGQLADSMNTLLAAVETQFAARLASEERMRQFLADASHELRTPLTSIRGYAELSRMKGTSDASEADSLARIEAEGTRMSRLVDDLLTLARTDQGADRQFEPLDLADVLVEAVDGVRAAYPSRPVEVIAEPDLVVRGDRDQLVRVVRNLAANAAVHTRPEGLIRVSVAREGDWAAVHVSDAGPGLPPEEAAHVFERFWRADKARTRARGGSGLGLSIVAALVQSHGGSVRFDSTVEGGSTVTVYLPLAA